MYWGISSKLDRQSERFELIMAHQKEQIQNIKEQQVSNTSMLHMELEDLKKRLEAHESRFYYKEGGK